MDRDLRNPFHTPQCHSLKRRRLGFEFEALYPSILQMDTSNTQAARPIFGCATTTAPTAISTSSTKWERNSPALLRQILRRWCERKENHKTLSPPNPYD